MYIELETVRAGGHTDVERRDGVLWTEVTSATVGENLWPFGKELAQGLGLKAQGSRKNIESRLEP
jgi:hypothetical protein